MRHRIALAVAGAVLVSVVAAPAASAQNCRAWIGARGTGTCIDDQPVAGIPPVSVNRDGVETGPLFPGQTVTVPLG